MPAALLGIVAGSAILIANIYDGWMWLTRGITPPPNERVISTIDGVALFGTIVFGLLAGGYLVRVGLLWVMEERARRGVYRLWSLTPVLWMWLRLARYEMSYASAVDVSRSFYDFVMLIFMLLFLFAFARYVSGVGGPSRFLLAYGLCTGLFAVSGVVTRLAMYLMREGDAYSASQLAGLIDLLVGLFAVFFVAALIFARPTEAETDEGPGESVNRQPETAGGIAAPPAPSVEEILNSLQSDKGKNE